MLDPLMSPMIGRMESSRSGKSKVALVETGLIAGSAFVCLAAAGAISQTASYIVGGIVLVAALVRLAVLRRRI